MQTIEETLFANRNTIEKNARSKYPKTPLNIATVEIDCGPKCQSHSERNSIVQDR
jgi:hypothetical protein